MRNNNNGLFIPVNTTVGKRVFFHSDNADFREGTGIQAHVLLVVGFQECDITDNKDIHPL